MAKSLSNKQAVKIGAIGRRHQRSRKEESEFGLGQKEFLKCSDCGAVYFDKSWHHDLLEEKQKHLKPNRQFKFTTCPICKMKKDRIFEGELVIKLRDKRPRRTSQRGRQETRDQVMNTIKNSDKQARERDPMDRILWMEEREDGLHIFTSENQLAVRMGKKLKSSFGGSKLEVKHTGEDVIRVYWEY